MIIDRKRQISKAKVMNTGSLFAVCDIDYTGFDVYGVNMANAPQYLNYDLKYIKKYQKSITKGAKVLIVLADFVFAVGRDKFAVQNDIYYKEFVPWQIDGFSFLKFISVYMRMPIRRVKKIINRNAVPSTNPPMSNSEKVSEIEKMIKAWERDLGIPSVNSGELTSRLKENINVNIQYLKEIIRVIEQVGAEPILVIPPCSREMNKRISKECIQNYLLFPISKCVPKTVRIYNYLYDRRFEELDYYINGFCLNTNGSRLFTEALLKDIGFNV